MLTLHWGMPPDLGTQRILRPENGFRFEAFAGWSS
jgi:hypothetical protein